MNTTRMTSQLSCLFLLILAVLVGTNAFGYDLTAVSTSGNCGQTNVDVTISVNDATGMMAFQFNLYYDPALLQAVSGAGAPLIAGWVFVANTSFADHVAVAAAGVPLTGGSGAVCTIRFNVRTTAPNGSSSALDLRNTLVNDIPVPPTVEVDGVFFITCGPACSTVSEPADGAAGIVLTNIVMDWYDSPGATSYNFYFGVTLPPPLLQVGLAASFYTMLGPLMMGTTYYWQVVPINGTGPASGCAIWSFTTVAGTSVTVHWVADPLATAYDLYRITGPCGGAGSTIAENLTVTNYVDASLAPATTYSYYVVSKNACGSSAVGACSSITTPGILNYTTNPGPANLVSNSSSDVEALPEYFYHEIDGDSYEASECTDKTGAASSAVSTSYSCASALGDVNGNAAITSMDVSLILQHVVGLITLDSPSQCRADCNGNAVITSYDAALVLQCVVGLCSNLSLYPDFLASCTAHGLCP